MLTAASAQKDGNALFTEVRQSLNVSGESFSVSLVVFKREAPPPFLVPGKEMELHHCYLFLLEYGKFLIVSKRGTAEFMELIENKIDTLNYQEITGLKITASTQFVKVGVTNMDTTATAMRRATYEAQDLKNNLPPISTSNKIITSLKIKNKGKDTSLSPGTSRINDLGKRENVNFFCYWAAVYCKQIEAFAPSENYLSNFAERLDFRSHIKDLKVMSILFNFAPLLEGLNDESIAAIYFTDSHSRDRNIDLKTLSESHDFCLNVQYKKGARNYRIENAIDKSLSLTQLADGFAIHSDKLDRITVLFTTGETISLLSLINRYGLYIISFNNADIRFSNKTLFRDNRLLKNLPYFLNSFETQTSFSSIKSEKGKQTVRSTMFGAHSLFSEIESRLSNDCDFLFCDDLGNEWADYIGFKEDKFIRFYHAKYSTKNFSASAFQEVVAQAQKNIGNFNFNQSLDTKTKKVGEKYAATNIPRLRKGTSSRALIKKLQSTFNSPQTTKELAIVVNFMSKGELDMQLKLLAKGKAKNEAIQILWLLSTLFSECITRGIVPKVITRP